MSKVAKTAKTVRKEYKKPEVKKHKSVAVVSGSGCSYYSRSSNGYTYYH